MNRSLLTLVGAQFLSAFGDNAILFTVIAMSLKSGASHAAWYIPALQSAFLVAYVTLTPWVGALADRYPKPRILFIANLVRRWEDWPSLPASSLCWAMPLSA